jgi:hypothetical protein
MGLKERLANLNGQMLRMVLEDIHRCLAVGHECRVVPVRDNRTILSCID